MDQQSSFQNNPQASVDPKTEKQSAENDLIKDLTIGLPGPLKLFQESLQLFRKKLFNFSAVIALCVIPLYLLSKLPLFINLDSQISLIGFYAVYNYLAFVLLSFMLLALLLAIKNNEENISFFGSYKLALKHFLEFWKIILLLSILIFAGKFFFIVPSIILTVWFSVAIMVYLVEDIKGINALLISRQYVQGHWSSVFLRLVLLFSLITVISLPLYVFWSGSLLNYFYDLYLLISVFFLLPLTCIYLFLIYGNLRLLKADNSEFAQALAKTSNIKIKLRLLKPAFIQGMIPGIPVVIFLIYLYLFRIYTITGDSMLPNYKNNELITANVFTQDSQQLTRGDVVFLRSPENGKKVIIKRIIGLPYDKFNILNGSVYINGEMLDESGYLSSESTTGSGQFINENSEFIIPAENYIVLGDNRENSVDSRDWGLIRKPEIIAKAGICLWGCPDIK